MITLLLGHRGVGKTSLLSRLRDYGVKNTVDLDAEIERRSGQTIEEIFTHSGEAAFRKLEEATLLQIVAQSEAGTWIAVGAGYQGAWPDSCRRWWIRRPTDRDGRIFLDRPRLNATVTPIQEYRERFSQREARFSDACDSEISLLEGFLTPTNWEAALLGINKISIGGLVTILPHRLKDNRPHYLQRLKSLAPVRVEVRDDLLPLALQEKVATVFAPHQVLFSHRQGPEVPSIWQGCQRDWALELGTPAGDPEILSQHTRLESLAATFADLPKTSGAQLKLAIPVSSFQELRQGHDWWLKDPTRRSFLPMSQDGRWAWYRLLAGNKMPISFWREGDGSALDQPLLGDQLRTLLRHERFAAVIGWPVRHSFTPAEQTDFFAAQDMAVVGIPIPEQEWSKDSLDFLTDLGLRAAAITSPHKNKAAELCSQLTDVAESLSSVNTMVYQEGHWRGHNTDAIGFLNLTKEIQGAVGVWGGGGTKAMMQLALPEARFFSARAPGPEAPLFLPRTVVWAVGRSAIEDGAGWPPTQWHPDRVIDLNYSEDSPGREYALQVSAKYISGLAMFQAQAAAQREFWMA